MWDIACLAAETGDRVCSKAAGAVDSADIKAEGVTAETVFEVEG